MFAREKFRTEHRRAIATARLVPANDNHRIARHALASPGRTALVGHWHKNAQTGRLEWHWSLEAISDEPEVPPSGQSRARPGNIWAVAGIINNTSINPDDRDLRSSCKSE